MKKLAPSTLKPTRGRPPRAKDEIELERQRIGLIARALFQESGFEAISIRRLAKEAGITTKTLYAYFTDKREILQYVWQAFFEELFRKIDEIAASNMPRGEALNSAALCYVDYWIAHPERYRLVFMANDVSQKDVSAFLGLSNIIERYAVFADLLPNLPNNLTDGASHPSGAQTPNLNALICALNGVAHSLITISDYSWGAPKDLLDVLLSSITPASPAQ